MKKIILVFVAGSALALGGIHGAYAQGSVLLPGTVLVNAGWERYVSPKALRDFSRTYKGIGDAQWIQLKEGGFVCEFTDKMILSRVIYDKKGNWLHTIAGYGGDKLAKDKRAMVRSTYYDYDITYVDEIDLPGNKKVYLIHLQDEKSIKIIRICNDEMEMIEEYEKSK
ncbi:MAG TPA: hypothetical protein VK518_10935 [Puia sp.]|nr:hypothetical protein [Puia sp.]